MKRTVSLVLLCAMTLAILSACQKTPEAPVVVQKDMEQMIEKAQETPETSPDNKLAERLGAPERFTANYSYSERLSMTADAQIILPDASVLPTVRVKPADFSQEMIDKMYEYLVGDTVMYEATARRTKAQIEADILEWKKTLEAAGTNEQAIAQANEKIALLTEAYKTAPESADHPTGNTDIKTLTQYDIETGAEEYSYQGVQLVERPEEKSENQGKYFSVHQNNTGGEIIKTENVGGFSVIDTASRGARFIYADDALLKKAMGGKFGWTVEMGEITQAEWEQMVYKPGELSPADAERMANELLKSIGAEDMRIGRVKMYYQAADEVAESFSSMAIEAYAAALQDMKNGKRSGDVLGVTYTVECQRTVGGANVTSDTISSYFDDAYGKQWYYERMEIKVCDGGIFLVTWTSPYAVVDTVTEDTAMLSFDEIENIIEQMFRVKWEPAGEFKAEYNITQLVLSLRRVAEQDNVEGGLIIPVWDLYGTCSLEPALSGKDKASFLTINAIDGSIIDPGKGY